MAIVVPCPGCPTKLSAPDTAAGKQIRCPKCGTTAPVPALIPAEEVPVVNAAIVPPKPKPKPVVADDDEDDRPRKKKRDDDDDDEDDDRPRKKKKRACAADEDDDYDHDRPRKKARKAGGGGGGKVAILVLAGLFLLGGIGLGIYFLTGKGSPFAKKTPVPPGWVQHTSPHNGFKAYFPKEPQEFTVNGGFGGLGGGRFGGRGGFAGGNELANVTSVTAYTSGGGDAPIISLNVARFQGEVPAAIRDSVRNLRTGNEYGVETRKVRWLGYDAGDIITGATLTRIVYTDRLMIQVQITGPRGQRASRRKRPASSTTSS